MVSRRRAGDRPAARHGKAAVRAAITGLLLLSFLSPAQACRSNTEGAAFVHLESMSVEQLLKLVGKR